MPRCWAANGMMVVVPPKAAETVAEWKSSAVIRPLLEICSTWQWLSMPPGSTSSPAASMSSRAGGQPVGNGRDPAVDDADIAACGSRWR